MKKWMPIIVLGLASAAIACSGAAAGDVPQGDSLAHAVATTAIDSPETDSVPVTAPPVEAPAPAVAKEVLLGMVSPAKDTAFAPIASKYTTKTGIYMRREAYAAFERMHKAAAAEGVNLVIVSALRTFGDQKGIWENKWNGKTLVGGKNLSTTTPDPVERARAILRYSSMPGSSRHHWGTDIDLNSLENSYFASGQGKKIYDWLTAHAAEYGFCQPYTAIGPERPHGYQEEKWHWSYMPIASKFLAAYRAQVALPDIKGFQGSETAAAHQIIDHYVAGIAPPCLGWQH